ncbi:MULTISPECIES: hypothetical protein [unclassified Leptolyngbya]|uniref:hypothetical protein n=1 Tax=unclassified Leptolyngbya TaxID=2650499 RepID=UPI0018F03652|nr:MULTISPECIES: hypothetical protein [unclassified Leptolyngbya]
MTSRWRKLPALLLFGVGLLGGRAIAQTLPLPADLIAFNSPPDQELLLEREAEEDF